MTLGEGGDWKSWLDPGAHSKVEESGRLRESFLHRISVLTTIYQGPKYTQRDLDHMRAALDALRARLRLLEDREQ